MNAGQESFVRGGKLLWVQPEDAIQFVGPRYRVPPNVPRPTADVGEPLRLGQFNFPLSQLLLNLIVGNDHHTSRR
jgi:hypothetical protein